MPQDRKGRSQATCLFQAKDLKGGSFSLILQGSPTVEVESSTTGQLGGGWACICLRHQSLLTPTPGHVHSQGLLLQQP